MKHCVLLSSGAFLIVTSVNLFPTGLLAQPRELTARIDSVAHAAIKNGPIAGLSIGVVQGSNTLHAQGYGWADIQNGVPATARTVYDIASVTKLFTATAVMMLVKDGKLSLGDKLATLLPEFPNPEQGREITLRHLLNHTAGLNDIVAADLKRWEQTREPLTPAFVLDYLRGRPLDFEPGTHWSYSNTGFYLTALIIERASSQPYGKYVRSAIAEPLGLRDTFLCDENLLPTRRTVGYTPSNSGLVRAPVYQTAGEKNGVQGDGGLCATVLDLARLPKALTQHGLLSEATLTAMTRPTTLASGTPVDYGLGVRRGILDGHALWGHTGGVTSYWSVLVHYPEDDITIAVLVNTDGGAESALTIEGQVARLVLKLGAPMLADHALTSEAKRVYLGTYVSEVEGVRYRYRIVEDGERIARVPADDPLAKRRLLYQGAHAFGREDWPMNRLVFHVEADHAVAFSAYHNGIFADFFRRTDQ